jgi:hypothetical protein
MYESGHGSKVPNFLVGRGRSMKKTPPIILITEAVDTEKDKIDPFIAKGRRRE